MNLPSPVSVGGVLLELTGLSGPDGVGSAAQAGIYLKADLIKYE